MAAVIVLRVAVFLKRLHASRSFLWVLCVLVLQSCAWAGNPAPVRIEQGFSERTIGRDLAIFEDPSGQLTFDSIRTPELAAQFLPSSSDTPSFGYTSSVYWARFGLNDVRPTNSWSAREPLYLTLAYAPTDRAELFCTDDADRPVLHQRAGDHVPVAEWPTRYRDPTFQILPHAKMCWLRLQSGASMQMPLTLYSQSAFFSLRLQDNTLQALYFGALLVMIAYNALVALTTRSRTYAVYVLFLMSFGLLQCALGGLGYQLLWSFAVGYVDSLLLTFMGLSGGIAAFFAILLLDLRQSSAFWYRVGVVYLGFAALHLLVGWVLPYSVAIQLVYPAVLLWGIFLLGSGLTLSLRGVRVAKIFLAAWLVLIAGTLISVLPRLGFLPLNAWTSNMQQIGSVLEFVLLSFALSDRIKTLQNHLLQSQEKITDSLRASEQLLERKVVERTAALEAANQEILSAYQVAERAREDAELAEKQARQALDNLKNTQGQLIAAEKMASLGLLVSNVAHEINTPIGAVQSSGQTVADSVREALINIPRLLEALNHEQRSLFLQLITPTQAMDESLSAREERNITKQVTAELEAVGMDGAVRKARLLVRLRVYRDVQRYLPLLRSAESDFVLSVANGIADVLSGTANINTAAAKIGRIVLSLKQLSGGDRTTAMFESPVYRSIESAIVTLESRLQQVDVVRNYQDVAPLRCDPEALQQVWIHLLSNALYACNHQGVIMIGLRALNNQLQVQIVDFGCGIAADIQDRIFEPFFTTRASGEGGGMGLSIAKRVVEQHQGTLRVQSESGQGTTVLVTLPYNPSQ
jgi:signal transduction histidine kinase